MKTRTLILVVPLLMAQASLADYPISAALMQGDLVASGSKIPRYGSNFDPDDPQIGAPGKDQRRPMETDSLNVRLVGKILYGPAYSVFVQADYAYLCAGRELFIIGISQPGDARMVGQVSMAGIAEDVYVSGGYAYVASPCGGYPYPNRDLWGLRVVDVSTPSSPVEVGFCGTGHAPFGMPLAVHVLGDFAYLACVDSLRVIDVSIPSSPAQVGACELHEGGDDIWVSGQYAYVVSGSSGWGGLTVVDVSNPSSPFEAGFCSEPQCGMGVQVSGDYAFIADTSCGLWVIDVSDPTNPSPCYCIGWPAYGVHLSSSGGFQYAYLADEWGMSVWDVTEPYLPNSLGHFYYPCGAREVFTSGNYAYLAAIGKEYWWPRGAGLRVIDVADPANPVGVAFLSTELCAQRCRVLGNYAYLAYESAGLRILDLSNPSSPIELSRCGATYPDLLCASGVDLSGAYAYLADPVYGDGCLRVVDVSDPASPFEVASCAAPYAVDVDVAGNYAYVVAMMDSGLWVIDVNDPTSPVQVGHCASLGMAQAVRVSNGYAYIADTDFGLRVADVRDPTHPTQIGSWSTPDGGYDVWLSGTYTYVAASSSGLRIIDVSDPTSPLEVGHYDTPDRAIGVSVSGGLAYIADGYSGLRIIDVSIPSSPVEVGYYDAPGLAWKACVSGDYIYVSNRDSTSGWQGIDDGLWVFQYYATGVEEAGRFSSDLNGPRLGLCHPNPFSHSTTISYCVPGSREAEETGIKLEVKSEELRVTLGVYDLSGRLVRTFVDGPKQAGLYTVEWDGTTDSGERVSAGVYFYCLSARRQGGSASGGRAGAQTATKKMVLLR